MPRRWGFTVWVVAVAGAVGVCGRASPPQSTRRQAVVAQSQPSRPVSPSERPLPGDRQPEVTFAPREERPVVTPIPRASTTALPSHARCVLVSPDRRLALVDGRIVGPGDRLDGATVVDIAADGVLVEEGLGRRRRLGVGVAISGLVVR